LSQADVRVKTGIGGITNGRSGSESSLDSLTLLPIIGGRFHAVEERLLELVDKVVEALTVPTPEERPKLG
jgi:hypothetical protein